MRGMSADNGAALDGVEHLAQSIRDILTTPIGSRVMRRDYGSRIFELVDQPFGEALQRAVVAATAEALQRWEPRLRLGRVTVVSAGEGRVSIDLDGTYLPAEAPIRIDGVVV